MSITIALVRESRHGELRVALDPTVAAPLQMLRGIELVIESGCGRGAGFADGHYEGARFELSFAATVANASLTLKVAPPTPEEAALLPEGSVLVCSMSPFQNLPAIRILQQRRITTLAMDLVPRITRAQSMDVLSSQATVAGYKAALLAAELCPRLFPMMITAAGTLRPSRIVVIGAGVAGLQAIATCRRLGAQVQAYDIRRAAKEHIESLGATMIDTGVEAESHGGYARALTVDERETQHDVLATHLSQAHAVICAAAIPGRVAPQIITEDMVERMMPDTVIIDMAADTGGNCVLTRPGERVIHHETLIVGALNLPSSGAVHASEMYARNLWSLLQLILPDGELVLERGDVIIASCLLTDDAQVCHAPTLSLMLDAAAATPASDADPTLNPRATATTAPGDMAAGWLDDDPPADLSAAPDTDATDAPTGLPPDVADGADSVPARPAQSTDEPSEIRSGTETAEAVDNFTRIRGIGPVLSSSLQAYGFKRFRQLAELDARGVEQLEQQLELDGHILRDDWPGQARRLERSS